jgi:hypothetical protein
MAGVHGYWQAYTTSADPVVFAEGLGTGLNPRVHYAVSLKKYSSRMPLGFYRVGVTLGIL